MKSSCRQQRLRNLTRGLEASRTAPPLRAVGAAMIAVGAGVMSRSGLHGRAARIVSTSHTSNGCSAWDYLGALLVCYVQPSTFYLH